MGETFVFGNFATGHLSGIFFFKVSTSGHKGSIDTGLIFLSCPGAEPISGHTNKQTDIFGYYNIDIENAVIEWHSLNTTQMQ
jgi:hypothetical protein